MNKSKEHSGTGCIHEKCHLAHGLRNGDFKCPQGLLAERTVDPRAMIKDFNPLEGAARTSAPRCESVAMHEFAYESAAKGTLLTWIFMFWQQCSCVINPL